MTEPHRPDIDAVREEIADLRGTANLAASSMERVARDLLEVERRRRRNVVGQIVRDVALIAALLLVAYGVGLNRHSVTRIDAATSPAAQAEQARTVASIEADLATIKADLAEIQARLGIQSSTPPATPPATGPHASSAARPTTTTSAPPSPPTTAAAPPPPTTTTRPCLVPVTIPGGRCP